MKEKTAQQKMEREQRMAQVLKPHAVEKALSAMEGWKMEGNRLRKEFSFGSGDEAARAGAVFIRRASKSKQDLEVSLKGARLGINLLPSADQLTRTNLQFAKRLDRPLGAEKKKK